MVSLVGLGSESGVLAPVGFGSDGGSTAGPGFGSEEVGFSVEYGGRNGALG